MGTSGALSPSAAGCICAVVGLLLYINSLSCGLVFDDTAAVMTNDDLRPSVPWSDLLQNDFWGTPMRSIASHKSYRPLIVATFRLNYMLHELQPLGYHLVNVLLHSAVCYLYVLLCGVVFSEVWPALIAGLLFAVHPIHTEAVTGVVGRAEVMSAIFFILSFMAYEKSKLHNSVKGHLWLVLSLFLSILSLLSKEQGVTVVAVCVAYDFIQNFQESKQSLVKMLDALLTSPEKLAQWFMSFLKRAFVVCIFTIMTIVLRVYISHGGPSKDLFHKNVNPPVGLDTPYRQLSWMYLCFVNSWLLLNPYNLNVDWRFGAAPVITSLMDPHNLLTLSTFLAVAGLGLWSVSGSGPRHRAAVLGLSLLVLPYIPASNLFFPVGFVIAERVLYIPSMGFCMLVGYGTWCLLRKVHHSKLQRIVVGSCVVYLLASHSLKTVTRNPDWQSNMSVFIAGLKYNPHNGLLLSNIGKELKDSGNFTAAEEVIRKGVEVSPTHSGAHFNLGKLLYFQKRYQDAQEPLRRAVELIPVDGNGTSHIVLASYLLAVTLSVDRDPEKMEEALEICDNALRRDPMYTPLFVARSSILLQLKRPQEALITVEEGIKRNKSSPELYMNLAGSYTQLDDRVKSKEALRQSVALNPNYTDAVKKLAFYCSEDHEFEEAEELWKRLILLEPLIIDSYHGLASIYFQKKDYDKSEEVLFSALQVSPDHLHTLLNVGNLYYKLGKYEKAVEYLTRVTDVQEDYLNAATLLEKSLKRLEVHD